MLEYLDRFERGIYYALMVMLALVIFLGVLELVVILFHAIFLDFSYRLANFEILEIFGYFLLILIGIGLLETIKAYLIKNEIHVEIIILVAIIAVARKIILLDPFARGGIPEQWRDDRPRGGGGRPCRLLLPGKEERN